MSGPVSHLELCHALHTLHRAMLNGTWTFRPFAALLDNPNSPVIWYAYLEERLYIFRSGGLFKMAYGKDPSDAFSNAYLKENVK